MATDLPAPIADYIAGANAFDADACTVCFTEDAVVVDEGRERQGLPAIRAWKHEVSEKYRPHAEVLDAAQADDREIVTCRVSGTFPGSPINLRYAFTLVGGRISRLEVVA